MVNYLLNDGTSIPAIGLGTYKITESPESIAAAIEAGYKLIDTAWIYGNEALVGEGMRLAADRGFAKDYLVATKVWPNHYTKDLTKRSLDRSIRELGVDQLDIVYLHWPAEGLSDAWKVLEQYKDEGIIRTIGVSNFTMKMLEEFKQSANIPPALNQIEIHPFWPEIDMVSYLQEENIRPVAYSPLARMNEALHATDTIKSISSRLKRKPNQIILRWLIEREIAVVPKSVDRERQRENLAIFDFELTPEDIAALSVLGRDTGKVGGADPNDLAWQAEMKALPL